MAEREDNPRQKSVLFICTGNTCRSPMAEALFRARLKEVPGVQPSDWRVESAGIMAEDGLPATKHAQAALSQRGVNIEAHRARTINSDLVQDFDLILALTEHHKEAMQIEYPQILERIYLLSEMSGERESVVDPYGEPLEAYQRTADQIDRLIAGGMSRIMRLVERSHNGSRAR